MESRKWLSLLPLSNGSINNKQFTVLSFNLLAQVLIQKQQFPHCNSQMLRWKQRCKRVLKELKLTEADILLVQEVDSFEEFYKKEFDKLGYYSIYNYGNGKKHGCCIAFKNDKFDLISQSKIDLDSYPISKNTYSTNNILQLVKIQFKESELGLILTNNHLFWHPNYDYERTRQFSILTEATKEFAKDCDFPVINGGDFNTTPSSLGYISLTRSIGNSDENKLKIYNEINNDLKNEIEILKEKVEKCKEDLITLENCDELEKEGSNKNSAIKKLKEEIEAKELNITQLENPDLLPIEEIVKIIESNEPSQSAYSDYTKMDSSYLEPKYGYEPIYTNVTPFFKGTLDYLFYRSSSKQKIEVDSLFSLPDINTVSDGIPTLEFGSDHISIAAKFNFKQ